MGCKNNCNKLNIGVLFGGRSGEHEVSVKSARSVFDNLNREQYDITLIGITKEGLWVLPDESVFEKGYVSAEYPLVVMPVNFGDRKLMQRSGNTLNEVCTLDVIFPVMHGPFGEDGTVQGLFELSGMPYVGAGVLGSAAGMDKDVMKQLFLYAGLATAPWIIVSREDSLERPQDVSAQIEETFGYPCFVKPVNMGSSVGINRVDEVSQLASALADAAQYDRKVIVEQSVEGAREIECSVLGNNEIMVSVPGEIIPSREFYSYESKYIDDDSTLLIPAPLSDELTIKLQDMAKAAYQAIQLEGLTRVDFLMRKSDNEIFINEVNTLPGFTNVSMYPKLWEASGLAYCDLLDKLILLAQERSQKKTELRTSYV